MTSEEREDAIRALFPMVRRMARRVARVIPIAELDDVVGDGSVGAVRAVDSFDPSRGVRLETYARRLILGSMLNGLRRTDPVSERVRRRIRLAERERYRRSLDLGRIPTRDEMERADPRLRDANLIAHRLKTVSTDTSPDEHDPPVLVDWSGEPSRLALATLDRDALRVALRRLPPRQREVVGLHYYHEMSMHAIGRRLQISPQRVSQLHAIALGRLRTWIAP